MWSQKCHLNNFFNFLAGRSGIVKQNYQVLPTDSRTKALDLPVVTIEKITAGPARRHGHTEPLHPQPQRQPQDLQLTNIISHGSSSSEDSEGSYVSGSRGDNKDLESAGRASPYVTRGDNNDMASTLTGSSAQLSFGDKTNNTVKGVRKSVGAHSKSVIGLNGSQSSKLYNRFNVSTSNVVNEMSGRITKKIGSPRKWKLKMRRERRRRRRRKKVIEHNLDPGTTHLSERMKLKMGRRLNRIRKTRKTRRMRKQRKYFGGRLAAIDKMKSETVISSNVPRLKNIVMTAMRMPEREMEGGEEEPAELEIGMAVEAQYGGKSKWYKATVMKVNKSRFGDRLTYDLNYADGDREQRVKHSLIRVMSSDNNKKDNRDGRSESEMR